MAATVVNKEFFGAAGVSDPYIFEPGLVGITRRVNFNIANVAASSANAFVGILKGMVVTAVRLEEVASGGKCVAGTVQLKIADKADSANDKAVGTTLAVGGSAPATSVQALSAPVVISEDSVVSLYSSAKQEAGGVIVTLIGYLPDGESVEHFSVVANDLKWRAGQTAEQLAANISGGDAYTANSGAAPIYPVAADQ